MTAAYPSTGFDFGSTYQWTKVIRKPRSLEIALLDAVTTWAVAPKVIELSETEMERRGMIADRRRAEDVKAAQSRRHGRGRARRCRPGGMSAEEAATVAAAVTQAIPLAVRL